MHGSVVVVPRLSAQAPWLSERVGITEAAERAKRKVYWNGPSGVPDVQDQIDLIDRAVSAGAYGIVVEPNSYFALNYVIQKALSEGIPVVILGEPVAMPPARHLSFVLNDVNQTGKLVAERLNKVMQGSGEVALLGLDPQSPGSVERADSIEAALGQIAPRIRIVKEVTGSSSAEGSEQSASLALHTYPRLSAIVALNAREGYSALEAVRSSGARSTISVIVCDQDLQLLSFLRHGRIDSIVIQNMRELGSAAMANILTDRQGRAVVSPRVLEPAIVTRENIGDEPIQQLLLMHWGQH